MLNWYAINSATYYAAEANTLDENNLYFLTDTHEIYKGANNFTESLIVYTGDKPTTPARGKIYLNSATLKGEIYTGSAWVEVIKPVASTVAADGVDPVSGKAVADYVAAEIAGVTGSSALVTGIDFAKGTAKLTYTTADKNTHDIILEGLAAQLDYDSDTGVLSVKDISGNVVGTSVNLGLDRFVKGAEYDADAKTIIMYFDEEKTDKITIPVGDLVDTYTAENSSTISMTVTNNKFTASVIASQAAGNVVELKNDGIFVAATDLSNYQTLVADASTTAIPMLNAAGQLINGTKAVGGATLAETPNANTLATEVAVSAMITSTKATLEASLAAKMALVTSANENAIATFDAAGQVKDSGKAVGGATLSATPNANTLATEVAVNTAVTGVESALDAKISSNTAAITTLNAGADVAGSVDHKIAAATTTMVVTDDVVALSADVTDDQIPTAKSVYNQLTWKTTL